MSNVRENFYRRTIVRLIPNRNSSVLICGGGSFDKLVFELCGFTNVTVSNLDSRMTGNEYAPFHWAYEDAESLSYADASFDYVVIHAAVHHASSPHRVLTEMYRVARKGVLAIESRDSWIMRLLERYGLTQVYEHAAVYYNGCQFGGVNNTEIPNFVYRWTEREIEKTIKSYAPYAWHRFDYAYETSFPLTPELEKNGMLKYILLRLAQPFFWLLTRLFIRQQNLFAFFIEKPTLPDHLFPWIRLTDGNKLTFNVDWGNNQYRKGDPAKKR